MDTPVFHQARLKRKWADFRIAEAKRYWNWFLESNFCEIRAEPDPESGGDMLRIHSLEFPPGNLVFCIGDAIHNLRASLDYVVSELLGWKNTRLTFPMGETREELKASFRTEGLEPCPACGRGGKGKGRNAAIEMAFPGFGEMIVKDIRPYKAANGFLWPLNKLDVRDKHRLVVPTVTLQEITGICAVDANNNRVVNMTAGIDAGGVARITQFGAGGLKIENYGKPTAQILFNEAGVIEGMGVFETLANMAQAVDGALKRITDFALEVGWTGNSLR